MFVFIYRYNINAEYIWTVAIINNGPTMRTLNAERPKQKMLPKMKKRMVAKQAFRASICTIFCLREATCISDDFRMRAGPEALKTPSKLRVVFIICPIIVFSICLEALGGHGSMVPWWGH